MAYQIDSSLTGFVPAAKEWVAALDARGATPSGQGIVTLYNLWCLRYHLDANLAIAQACHEATWFTSDRWKNEWNPAGLGITADNTPPNPFSSATEGIEAHCEHLCCHAYTEAECPVDHTLDANGKPTNMADRRHTFHRGENALSDIQKAPYRWAAGNPGQDPQDYVRSIVAIANSIVPDDPPAPPNGGTVTTPTIIDVRGQLPTAPGQGSGQTQFPKSGIIFHYTGPPVDMNADEMMMLVSYANFHIGPYLNEAGIAYHYDIAPDGTIRLLRDPAAVLWHCGAWPYNASHYAVHLELGEGQHATAAQLASAIALSDFLRAQDGFGRDACKGHQEVSATSCPGTLMNDLVYPYRAGSDAPVSDYIYFKETGHGYANAFRDYFQKMGGVPIIGLPLSEEMDDPAKQQINGKTMTVQYAERERLEYHPELPHDPNAPGGGQVLLTRLGAIAAAAAGLTGPGIPTLHAPPPVMKAGDA